MFLCLCNFRFQKKKNRGFKRLYGAVLGIAISLIPLIVVMEVVNGMIEGITRRFLEIGTFHIQIKPIFTDYSDNIDGIIRKLGRDKEITHIIPEIQGIGLLYSRKNGTGIGIRALPEDLYRSDTLFRKYMKVTSGAFDLSKRNSMVISKEIAEKLDVVVGDRVKLFAARTSSRKRLLRPVILTISGICSTGYHELDSSTAYIEYKKGRQIFSGSGQNLIGIKVGNPFSSLKNIKESISRLVPEDWYVLSWFDENSSIYNSYQTTKFLLLFIMFLIVLVASVNIPSALLMLVMEKQEEIAILKSMGADPGSISLSFICTGLITGFLGTLPGIFLGLVIAVNINEIIHFLEFILNSGIYLLSQSDSFSIKLLDPDYYLEKIPIKIELLELLYVAFLSIFLAACGSYFPARKAAAIRPLDILRKH